MPSLRGSRYDSPGNGAASLRRRRDAGLIKRQTDYRRTVFFDQRQNPLKTLFLAGNRVYQHFAVSRLKPALQASGLEESITSGTCTAPVTEKTARSIAAGSSMPGVPTLTSSRVAPAATCSTASRRI